MIVAPDMRPPPSDVAVVARASTTLLLAVTAALVAATFHVTVVEIRFRLLHRLTWTSRELPWFSPLAYLAYFLVVALLLALVGWLAPRLITLRVRVALLAGLALFAIFLHYQRIHPWAELLLALGAGSQLGALVARRPLVWLRRARRLSLTLAATLAIYGLPAIVGPHLLESRRLAALPAAAEGAPNVILLILDTVRAASLSLYGYGRPTTPNLERLAKQAVTFETAIAPAPWTAPTHATLVSGQYASLTGVSFVTPMHDSFPRVAEAFSRAGYATGGFVANSGYAGRQTGIARGFVHFEDYPVSVQQLLWSATLSQTELGRETMDAVFNREWWRLRPALRRFDLRVIGESRSDVSDSPEIADDFMAWRDRVAGRPYFAILNLLDAHAPYRTPFAERYNMGREKVDRYDGAIAYEDSVIGSLVARLAERGDLAKTILVVLADHGEEFGEHGISGHSNSLYLQTLRVPLLIHAPSRAPAGLRDRRVVSLRDVPATMLDLAGVKASGVGGMSLVPGWEAGSPSTGRISPALAEIEEDPRQPEYLRDPDGPVKSLVDSSWHYVFNGDASEEVYDWRIDPEERTNLRATAKGERIASEARARIALLLGIEWPPPRQRAERSVRAAR